MIAVAAVIDVERPALARSELAVLVLACTCSATHERSGTTLALPLGKVVWVCVAMIRCITVRADPLLAVLVQPERGDELLDLGLYCVRVKDDLPGLDLADKCHGLRKAHTGSLAVLPCQPVELHSPTVVGVHVCTIAGRDLKVKSRLDGVQCESGENKFPTFVEEVTKNQPHCPS